MKREQQIKKEEIQEKIVTWKPREESIFGRKEWSLAMSGTEVPEVFSGFDNRKFIDDLHKGIQP